MEKNSHPGIIVIINCVLNAPLMVISIIGNTLVLVAILRTSSLRSNPSFVYLCSLAVSDLFVGCIVQPLYIASEIGGRRDAFLFDLSHVTAFSACGVSFCTIATISVDRCLALHYHMRYATLVTHRRVMFFLLTTWLTNFLLSSIYFGNWKISYIIVASGIILCVSLSTFSYIKIYRIVRRHQLQIQTYETAISQSYPVGNHLNSVRLKTSVLNTFVFYVFMVFCYVPKSVALIISSFSPTIWTEAWTFANTLVFYNSSANSILYCWRIRELRIAVLKFLEKVPLRPAMEVHLTVSPN